MKSMHKVPHLLFVEDDSTIRKLMCLAFHSNGMEVTEAQNDLEVLACFRFHPKKNDLVITDYQMPQVNEKELISALENIASDLPVIMVPVLPIMRLRPTRPMRS